MKPPFSYYGGKIGMASRIVSLMPEHRVYIEPFFGSGAVLFEKAPARHEIINDLEGNIVNFFRALRSQPEQLERLCTLTPHARGEYLAADIDDPTIEDLERARRFFVRIRQSFANTAGVSGWKVTTARTQSIPNTIRGGIARFADVAERLLDVSIEQCDAAGLIERLATEDTVVYADPPYLATTRRSGSRNRASDYRIDMADEESHRRLAGVLRATPAAVILSGYPSPLYEDLYADWWHTDVEVAVHSSNARTTSRGGRVERLWCNFTPAEPEVLAPPLRLFDDEVLVP